MKVYLIKEVLVSSIYLAYNEEARLFSTKEQYEEYLRDEGYTWLVFNQWQRDNTKGGVDNAYVMVIDVDDRGCIF